MDRRLFLKATSTAGAFAWLTTTSVNKAFSQSSTVKNSYLSSVPLILDPSLGGLTQDEINALFQVNSTVTAAQQNALYPQSVAYRWRESPAG